MNDVEPIRSSPKRDANFSFLNEAERIALQSILASDRFRRAPNLERMLVYLCRKPLQDRSSKTTEYDIAFEVLERPADFDPTTDSIVRVETHRLRKRLKEYYRNEGADDPIQIILPSGKYTPEFVLRDIHEESSSNENGNPDAKESSTPDSAEAFLSSSSEPEKAILSKVMSRWPLVFIGSVLLVIAIFWMVHRPSTGSILHTPTPESKIVSLPSGAAGIAKEIRILAGSSVDRYVDRLGNIWGPDAFYRDGLSKEATQPMLRPADPFLFQRWREGKFSYRIPLPDGRYRLHLYFSEPQFGFGYLNGGGEGSRVFDVTMNGQPLLTNLDILNDAGGGGIAVEKIFDGVHPGSDGNLQLDFSSIARGPALLNALAIVPAEKPGLPPIRIRCLDTSYTDQHGKFWGVDRYFLGGQPAIRAARVIARTPELYRGERYGNFSYAIPVIPGTYTVTLRFAETWFSPDGPRGGGVGKRVFDVLHNGRALLENFDIYKEARGSHQEIVKTFHGLRPDSRNRIVISFAPIVNYATVNAIEIVQEGIAQSAR